MVDALFITRDVVLLKKGSAYAPYTNTRHTWNQSVVVKLHRENVEGQVQTIEHIGVRLHQTDEALTALTATHVCTTREVLVAKGVAPDLFLPLGEGDVDRVLDLVRLI